MIKTVDKEEFYLNKQTYKMMNSFSVDLLCLLSIAPGQLPETPSMLRSFSVEL